MFYVTANLANKILPVASQGDIEGVFLALCLNCICLLIIGCGIYKISILLRKVNIAKIFFKSNKSSS